MSTIVLVVPVSQVSVSEGRAVATATVTNNGTAPESIVLGVFAPVLPAGGAVASAAAWTTVDAPRRDLEPGETEQFTVSFSPPEGTAAGSYAVRLIAYSAYGAPEESVDQARQVEVVVPAAPAPPPAPGTPWWIYVVAAALVLVVGVVAFLLLRPPDPCEDGGCPSDSPSPSVTTPSVITPSPDPPVVLENIDWRVVRIREGDAVTAVTVELSIRIEGGTIRGKAACNGYRGTFARDGNRVQVKGLSTNLMACFPAEAARQGSAFLNILRNATTVTQDGVRVELRTDDDRSLLLRKA